MKRRNKVKITPKLLKTLRKYWKEYQYIEEEFQGKMFKIEKRMEKETHIKGIEFFRSDDGICGIGDYGRWTMPLVPRDRLED